MSEVGVAIVGVMQPLPVSHHMPIVRPTPIVVPLVAVTLRAPHAVTQ